MSNESRLNIARLMLLAAPPGQLDSLLQDFKAIFAAGGETLDEAWLEQVRTDYQSTRTDADAPRSAKELYGNIKSYQQEYYSSKGVVSALVVTEEGDDLVVRTYAERIDESNCHAGSWTAQWTVMSSGQVKGTVKVHALCYEEGSIQLHSTRDFGPSSTTNVVKQIGDWEQQVVDSISELYVSMGEKLRSLRRVMPVTRTKMDWNVLSHRMVKLLGDTKE